MTVFDLIDVGRPRVQSIPSSPGNPGGRTARRARPAVPVVIYGNRWCGLTQMLRRGLDRAGVDYQYVDLDLHPEVEQTLRGLARGRLRTPVVYVDGEWMIAPGPREVQYTLARHGAAA